MDIHLTPTPTPTPTKSPDDTEIDTPPHSKPLKNHHDRRCHTAAPIVVAYRECMKNHAAAIGGHAVDGCGEFMPPPSTGGSPSSLTCAACGCHRNFHRRDPDELSPPPPLEYRPHHRHHPPPPPLRSGSAASSPDNSPSPPPISSSYYPSAPHMLLALSHGGNTPISPISAANPNNRKRFRTKFSQDQKGKMLELAERVEWKMQKKDEDLITEFCSEIGVEKGVFKVWMHNNKGNFLKKDDHRGANGGGINCSTIAAADYRRHEESKENLRDNSILGTNGSSSC